MKSSQKLKHFGQRMAMDNGYFLLVALTLCFANTLAFHSIPIFNIVPSRGIHHARNSIAFNIQCNDARKDPVHLLRNYFRPQDNLFSGIAELGTGFSIGVLYSEYSIIMTGCGPPDLSEYSIIMTGCG